MIGRVYKIIHNQSNICYVGSTIRKLKERWNNHKSSFKSYLNGKKRCNTSIFNYFKQFGIENFKIILIKEYEICDEKHLKVFEALWIYKLKAINELIPINIRNKSKFIKHNYNKQYRQKNKQQLDEQKKIYVENNRELYRDIKKRWYDKNKTIMIECQCGSTIKKTSLAHHRKTTKHLLLFSDE